GDAGTDWEIGVPSDVGPVTGAAGSANCAGTNLDADYGFNAVATLTSPEIDLTDPALTGVRLTMQHFPDIEDTFDAGIIRVIRASDGVQLGADVATDIDDDGVPPADWSEFSANLPDEVLGEVIKVVFELRSDDIQNQAGWYLDNVEVRAK
ncbi:MAG: hypothetical protein GWO24_30350, partial [Akkermansiaceae bacterium]|nr:hypothetical protein [Akkermansiaceae bacterium]